MSSHSLASVCMTSWNKGNSFIQSFVFNVSNQANGVAGEVSTWRMPAFPSLTNNLERNEPPNSSRLPFWGVSSTNSPEPGNVSKPEPPTGGKNPTKLVDIHKDNHHSDSWIRPSIWFTGSGWVKTKSYDLSAFKLFQLKRTMPISE